MKNNPLLLSLVALSLAPLAGAATVAVSLTTVINDDARANDALNLSSEGTLDWVNLGRTDTGVNAAARSEKSAVSLIGTVNQSNHTPATWTGSWKQSWTGGEGSLPTATNVQSAWEVKPQDPVNFANAPWASMDFQVTGLDAGDYVLKIYASRYQASGEMTASIGGAPNAIATLSSGSFGVFQVDFSVDAPSDILSIDYAVVTAPTGKDSNIGISNITLAAVPEPTVFSLVSLAGLMFAFRRRN